MREQGLLPHLFSSLGFRAVVSLHIFTFYFPKYETVVESTLIYLLFPPLCLAVGGFLVAGVRLWRLFAVAVLCMFGCRITLPLQAQTTSTLQGTVVDSQGSAIAGAEIALGGADRGEAIRLTTDQTGSYRLSG